jgi:CHASE2 domain-containing sensor protein
MNISGVLKKISGPAAASTGAVLAVLCGLLLWATPLGDALEIKSYDWLYRFGSRDPGDAVVLLTMAMSKDRNYEAERLVHAAVLDRLRADGAKLTVFDVHFVAPTSAASEDRLAEAMRANGRVVLMADITNQPTATDADNITLAPPKKKFLEAAGGRYGVGRAEVPPYQVARRHWPGLSLTHGETNFHSLGWAAAEAVGAQPDPRVENRWLRYYGTNSLRRVPWETATAQPPEFFRDKVVFIGSWPRWPEKPDEHEPPQDDKFSTPYTLRPGGEAVGGVEINAVTFLNLVRGDWLRREPAWAECLILVISGILLGGGLCRVCRVNPLLALLAAIGIFFALMCAFVAWSFYCDRWFPWLMIIGGQLPLALAWAWATARQVNVIAERHPGYTEVSGSFGEGSFGNVRVVRNAIGQLQALKEVVRAKFVAKHGSADLYEREFEGVKNYKPVSARHPGLLHVDFVSRNDEEGFYFYVMELGDAMDAGWEKKAGEYKPRDLQNHFQSMADERLPVRETLRIGIVLLEALDFLHRLGLVHGDIKPGNIIFVNDCPKLADVGLVRDINAGSTFSGTPGFMPPPPEPNGTRTADIYAMGKVLYVISTGRKAESFSSIGTTLVQDHEFMLLNEVVCRACRLVHTERYASAGEMREALRAVQDELDAGTTRRM